MAQSLENTFAKALNGKYSVEKAVQMLTEYYKVKKIYDDYENYKKRYLTEEQKLVNSYKKKKMSSYHRFYKKNYDEYLITGLLFGEVPKQNIESIILNAWDGMNKLERFQYNWYYILHSRLNLNKAGTART